MINSISGTITHKGLNNFFIENNGIEWDITASSKTISNLPSPGNTVRVLTYLNHREDSLAVFGFHDEDERSIFLELIKVSGIGPKQAVKILSGITAENFISALDEENLSVLSALPGIGQKTAQKIVFSLRGKIVRDAGKGESPYADIVKALSEMGFEYRKALKTVNDIAEDAGLKSLDPADKEKIILKRAIIDLSS